MATWVETATRNTAAARQKSARRHKLLSEWLAENGPATVKRMVAETGIPETAVYHLMNKKPCFVATTDGWTFREDVPVVEAYERPPGKKQFWEYL